MSSKAPRVAFHFFSLVQGGVERMRIALAHQLLARGYDVDFVLVEAKGDLLPQVPKGVRIVDLGAGRTLGSIRPLIRYFREDAPDVMFASQGPQNVAAVIARKIAGAKTWLGVMQHNALSVEASAGISLQQSLIPFAYRFALPAADKVLAVSGGVADDLAKTTGYPRERVGVLYNPACPEGGPELFQPAPQHRFLSGDMPVVLGVGRLVAQKGWETLIDAFAEVVKNRPARLVIAGVGPDHDAMQARIDSLGIGEAAELVGFQANPLAWMAAADLVVMSSRYEGFGNVLVEALAAGTRVVSTDCDFGPSEILDEGKFGKLVPVGDVAAMARAIVEALDSPADSAVLQARARNFSVAQVTDRYLETAFGSAA